MDSIDNIWKKFSDDMKFIEVGYDVECKEWNITYDDGYGNFHEESDKDMVKAAECMLEWYNERHTYKAAAEALWNIIDKIHSVGGFDESVSKLLDWRNLYITKENGNLVWNPSYEKNGITVSTMKKNEKSEHEYVSSEKIVESHPSDMNNQDMQETEKKCAPPDDGYPPFFMFNGSSLTIYECWGYDNNGNRVHVMIDYTNTSNTKIDKSPATVKKDMIIEMTESEFENYYTEAESYINALSMGYGIDNYIKNRTVYKD